MKKVFAVFFCLLFVFPLGICAQAASSKLLTYDATDYEAAYVPTKITYQSSDGYSYVSTYKYDDNFNKIKYTYSNSEGYKDEYTYAYDSYGRLEKMTNKYSYTDEKGSADSNYYVYTYSYNSGGNVAKETFKFTGNGYTSSSATTYKYDPKGRLTKATEKYSDIDDSFVTKYTYDSKGNLTKITYPQGNYHKYDTNKYDSLGRVIKSTAKYEQEEDTCVTTYKYGATGDWINYITGSNGVSDKYTQSFDSNGRIVKETTEDAYGEKQTTTYKYGSNGKVSKQTYSTTSGFSAAYTYTYDNNGNNTAISFRKSNNITGTVQYTYKKVTNRKAVIDPSIHLGFSKNTYTLSYASTAYNGKAKKPAVQIDGYIRGRDYRVSYSNNTNPGKGKIKITFINGNTPVIITFDITPAAPKSVKVSKTTKSTAYITWGKVTGAAKYVVYKYSASTGKYTKVATVTDPKATVKDLKAGTTYKFCVVAVASGSVKSAYSAKVSATTKK